MGGRSLGRLLRALLLAMGLSAAAYAGGPRWVTGAPYFSNEGQVVAWYTTTPMYYTDPGDLAPGVDHATADAIVAAAAGVWNIPTASLVMGKGGSLDEHVSGQDVYASTSGLIFPSDVQSSNWANKQIAVVYDTDGSVTDLMLGSGASDPSQCRQNAVTESVDLITSDGLIRHAILVLNGRCIGSSQEQQLQMQYQLMRAFGRVLGLGWSQTNDNVFTYAPQPTYQQAMHWPVMHPIDIICGPYTYQCMPEPFTLRPDDISAISGLYFIARGTAPPGKVDTLYYANGVGGRLTFPNVQGMQGVNVLGRRQQQYSSTPEDWYEASAVSGATFRETNGNPVSGVDSSMMGSMGRNYYALEGQYEISRIPIISGDWQNVLVDTESINPLYTGAYAVGPYRSNTVGRSGGNAEVLAYVLGSYLDANWEDLSTSGAPPGCNTSGDGPEWSPAPVNATGWWTDTLCGYGHTAWSSFGVQGSRSFTVEVQAQDEAGNDSNVKMLPVIGLWNASDATGIPPTVAEESVPLNGRVRGLTTMVVSASQASQFRVVIADQRGDGRPDFNYQGRVLYAGSVSPSSLGAAGGTITITGMGFRTGNAVLVNGVEAQVQSWSQTQIVATAPPTSALGTSSAINADVTVQDLTTGGTATMTAALAYAAVPPEEVKLVSAPSGNVTTGTTAGSPFAVMVTQTDGVSPVVGEAVVFSASGGGVQFGGCGTSTCTVLTNSSGVASTTVTPMIAGAVSLSAVANAGAEYASFNAVAPPPDVMSVLSAPSGVVYVGDTSTTAFAVRVLQPGGTSPAVGTKVVFSSTDAGGGVTSTNGVLFGACGAASCTAYTDWNGVASTTVTAEAAGSVTLIATGPTGGVSAGFDAVVRVRTAVMAQEVQYVAAGSVVSWQPMVNVTDNSGTVAGVSVSWSTTAGAMIEQSATTLVSAQGSALTTVEAGPIAGGLEATGTACAWGTVCAQFATQAVENAMLQVGVMAGGSQMISAGGTLAPVTLRVTDPAGHGVAGAAVMIYQTVSGPQEACSGQGRCPVAPVYETSQSQAVSDLKGLVTVTPLQMAGAETTNVAVSVGTSGFVSLALPVP